jgi:hypothetical protein
VNDGLATIAMPDIDSDLGSKKSSSGLRAELEAGENVAVKARGSIFTNRLLSGIISRWGN